MDSALIPTRCGVDLWNDTTGSALVKPLLYRLA